MNRAEKRRQRKLGNKTKSEQQSSNIHQALSLAKNHHSSGHLHEAQGVYQQILQLNPKHPDALHLLGVVAYQTGNYSNAVEYFTKALTNQPNFPEAYSNLGLALQSMGKSEEALESYQRALAIQTNFPEAYNNLGLLLQDLGRLDEALESYQQALAFQPNFSRYHDNLGTVLVDLGRLDEAVTSYQKALNIQPDLAETYNNLGNALKEMGKFGEAIVNYNKALAIMPDSPEFHRNLGLIYQDQGKLVEAVNSYRRALAINPDFADIHRCLATIKKFSEYDDDVIEMESTYALPNLKDEQRMHLAFGLGKAFEDLLQYKKAFSFYAEGNALKRKEYSYSIDDDRFSFKRLQEIFSATIFSKYQRTGCNDETPIFILGMPRSGTTLVEQILASHPQVYGAGELETFNQIISSSIGEVSGCQFPESILQLDHDAFQKVGLDYIQAIRKLSQGTRFITDKMPNNFKYVGLINLMLPNAKVIHCRRDPMDTCLSIFKNYFTGDHQYSHNLDELGHYYNLYRRLMEHWHEVIPGFIYDIQYEEVVANQAEQTRHLLKYCGLEWNDDCLKFHKTDRPVKTASAAQVRRPIYKDSIQSWKRYKAQLQPLLELL